MNKGIDKVRKSIAQRNKTRSIDSKKSNATQFTPIFPQEEEKHGYFPSFLDDSSEENHKGNLLSNFITKGILSLVLFMGVSFLLQSNANLLSKPKVWTSNMLTEEFPFARVYQWYQGTFGTPLAFTSQDYQVTTANEPPALPVSGSVTETFQANGSGIMIAPEKASPVSAWHEGVVVFAGNDRDTNKTVVIQHSDKSKSTYALLSSMDVHLYQYVSAGQRIGTINPTETNETVYFSIKKNNEYIDPIQVIEVDDLP